MSLFGNKDLLNDCPEIHMDSESPGNRHREVLRTGTGEALIAGQILADKAKSDV